MGFVRVPLVDAELRWTGVACIGAVIFLLSVVLSPPADPVTVRPNTVPLDKWRHFVAYAALGISFAYATADWDRPTSHVVLATVLVTGSYGLGLELVQGLLPGRHFAVLDAAANLIGVLLSSVWYLVQPYVDLYEVSLLR